MGTEFLYRGSGSHAENLAASKFDCSASGEREVVMALRISQLRKATPDIVESINRLLPQLSSKGVSFTTEELELGLRQSNFRLYVAQDPQDSIIGMGIIFFIWRPEGWMSEIHSVVVSDIYRGRE